MSPQLWESATKLAQAKGYISLWSPSREIRQRFIDAAAQGATT